MKSQTWVFVAYFLERKDEIKKNLLIVWIVFFYLTNWKIFRKLDEK